MSFFQLLTNAYVPYSQKNIRDNFNFSFINSAYNACHPIVAKTVDKSTLLKKQASLEIMLFLLAIGFKKLAVLKGKTESEIIPAIASLSVGLATCTKEDVYTFIENHSEPVDNYFLKRILRYMDLLNEPDLSSQLIMMVLFLERPLSPFWKDQGNYGLELMTNITKSKIYNNLSLMQQIQPLIADAVIEMRKSVDNMYR